MKNLLETYSVVNNNYHSARNFRGSNISKLALSVASLLEDEGTIFFVKKRQTKYWFYKDEKVKFKMLKKNCIHKTPSNVQIKKTLLNKKKYSYFFSKGEVHTEHTARGSSKQLLMVKRN